MSEFVYLYRGGERPDTSPQAMQEQMQKWVAWLSDLEKKGNLVNRGQPLENTGKLVRGKQKTVTDGPFAEAKDVVGGYTLVQAKDIAHAAELALGCPILAIGGDVEVRPVMKM